jgi:replicative superfamily II helicase
MVLDILKQLPSLSDIRSLTQSTFHHYPCLWQAKSVEAVLKRDRDIIVIAGTGMGKTLTFWMPLLFFPPGHIQVVITPLNLLGIQNMELLENAGIKAIFIGADTATSENFLVSRLYKDYNLIISHLQHCRQLKTSCTRLSY